MALTFQDICSKWRLNGERPSAFKHGLLALVLQRAQSCALGKATLQTSRVAIPRDLLLPLVFLAPTGSLLIYTPGTCSVIATPRPAHFVGFAGLDEVESRFSQVVA